MAACCYAPLCWLRRAALLLSPSVRAPPPSTPSPRTQIQSNALGALEALDTRVAERVYQEGCITGDRINGLCDGVTGDW